MLTLPVAVLLAAGLVSESRPVESFHALSLSGGLDVTVRKGLKPALKLTGEADDLAKIQSTVKSGTLIVGPREGTWRVGKVTAEVTVVALDALDASGGVVVRGAGLEGKKCSLESSGGVQVELDGLACEALALEASGGAGLKLTGTARALDLDASGGVQLDTRGLAVSQAKIRASGGVSGGLSIADAIDADLSGGVQLKVKGHPKVARADTSGSAKINYE